MTDPVWWFYLFWLPNSSTRASRETGSIAALLVAIYLIADLGSVGGGWMSSFSSSAA
jgi:ACS family hexuronate transporter-like MFS transporter